MNISIYNFNETGFIIGIIGNLIIIIYSDYIKNLKLV